MSANDTGHVNGVVHKASSSFLADLVRERDKTFSRPTGTVTKKDEPVEEIVRAAAATVGLISESLHHRREKKRAKSDAGPQRTSEQNSRNSPDKTHGALWELGDKEQQAAGPRLEGPSPKEPKDLAVAFLARQQSTPYKPSSIDQRLALPLVLPQRRPEKRARGFVRAYAPLLADVGIGQESFLDFIDTLNKALEPSPYIDALDLAGFIDVGLPEPTMLLIGFGLEMAVNAMTEAHSRFKSSKFMDMINEGFFHPRGLVCFFATWRSDTHNERVAVDFEGHAGATDPSEADVACAAPAPTQSSAMKSAIANVQQQMQDRMKATTGAFDGQQFAPLIFPTLEKTSQAHDGKKKSAFDRAGDWVDNWTDKRAQTKWKESNQDLATASALPKAEFRSRYADPSHPAASGDVVAFLTGGRWRYGHEKENKQPGPETESQDLGSKEPLKSPEGKEKDSVHTTLQPEHSQLLQARPEDSTSSTTLPETAEADGLQQPISEITASADKDSKSVVPDFEDVDVKDSNLTKSERKKLKEQEAKEGRKQKEREKKEKRAEEKEEKKQSEEAKKESRRVEKQQKEDDKKARKEREKDASLSSGSMSSLLKKDVLYLVIVNRPQED